MKHEQPWEIQVQLKIESIHLPEPFNCQNWPVGRLHLAPTYSDGYIHKLSRFGWRQDSLCFCRKEKESGLACFIAEWYHRIILIFKYGWLIYTYYGLGYSLKRKLWKLLLRVFLYIKFFEKWSYLIYSRCSKILPYAMHILILNTVNLCAFYLILKRN